MWRDHLEESEKAFIIKAYKDGATYREISKKFGFSLSTICRLVKGIRTISEARINAQNNGKWRLSDEGRIKLSENGKKSCIRSGKFWTKPEREFRELLLEIGIGVKFPDYIKEIKNLEDDKLDKFFYYQYPIQRYILDFVDIENKVAININGDYWHANPLLYNPNKLGKIQIINIRQDKNKMAFLKKNGWKVVDIWESEIYWNKDFVKNEIRAISLTEKPVVYTDLTGVRLSYCPPDWSEQIKRLWFKTDRPKRAKRDKIKVVCFNGSCKKEFEAIDQGRRTRKYCCVSCSSFGRRRVQRPSEQELMRLIETTPMIHIGKKYGVSNNAVKKWAKSYGIL